MSEPPEVPRRGRAGRASIADRAAKRVPLPGTPERDRYDRLLRMLQAGHEVPVERSRRIGLSWSLVHENFWKVLGAILVGIVVYVVVLTASGWLRDVRVETWAGPDDSVSSGQQLPTCALELSVGANPEFPTWVRVDQRLYVLSNGAQPILEDGIVSADYPPTGHRLGSLALHRVENLPEGRAGELMLVRLEPAPTGRVYRHAAACD